MENISTHLFSKLQEAINYAFSVHEKDVRKGTHIPYISHLMQVAGLVFELGGTQNEAIGGILHDVAEDAGGETALDQIQEKFGDEVRLIVLENSDSITADKESKAPWRERKVKYINSISRKHPSSLLVSLCDKIHNVRSLANDTRLVGKSHWKRFNASQEDSIWYYKSLLEKFKEVAHEDNRLPAAVQLFEFELNHLLTVINQANEETVEPAVGFDQPRPAN